MERANDTQIRAGLRSVMARRRLDANATSITCARGIVRMLGELRHQGAFAHPVGREEVEALENDIRGVRGVVRVHFDLANWRQLADGRWKPVERKGGFRKGRAHPGARDEGDW